MLKYVNNISIRKLVYCLISKQTPIFFTQHIRPPLLGYASYRTELQHLFSSKNNILKNMYFELHITFYIEISWHVNMYACIIFYMMRACNYIMYIFIFAVEVFSSRFVCSRYRCLPTGPKLRLYYELLAESFVLVRWY